MFVKSFATIKCRISTRIPIPIEKFDTIEQMGRFTLRDEGKTIAVGKIGKYKPAKAIVGSQAVNVQQQTTVQSSTPDMVLNLETGEMKQEEKVEAIKEEDEGEDDQ